MKNFEWVRNFKKTIKEYFKLEKKEEFNPGSYNFPFPIGIEINEKTKIHLSLDKSFVINNKKFWVLYLNTHEGYNSIGIKTDLNTGKERVKRYRPIIYKNNNHKEYLINNEIEYKGIYKWVTKIDGKSYRDRLNEFNKYDNHYLIISNAINRTNQQKRNNLGTQNGLWLILSNSKNIIDIFNFDRG